MKLQRASRKQAKIRLGIQGPSGSGKSYGALQVAAGLCGDYTKVAVIDTEQNSAALYSHLGPFNTVCIAQPFTPEKYIEALHLCEREGMEVIIIDSASHEWEGPGGILDIHSSLAGNSFTNWSKVTPRHNSFVQAILQSSCHVITTIRTKQDYVLTEKNGKQVPEKVGLKGVQRENIDYDLTLMFDLDIKHHATASKDRTSMFAGKPEMKLSPAIGEQIRKWCEQGDPALMDSQIREMIEEVQTVKELVQLYHDNPDQQVSLLEYFTQRRKQLEIREGAFELINPKNLSSNGHTKLQ
jgi:hypothetical protein